MASPRDLPPAIKGRVGHDFESFRSTNTEKDSGALGLNEFIELINTRFKGGRIKERPGLSKTNSSGAMSGSVMGITDERVMGSSGSTSTQGGAGVRCYAISCKGFTTGGLTGYDTSAYLFSLDENLSTPGQAINNPVQITTMFADTLTGLIYCAANSASLTSGSNYLAVFAPAVVTSRSDSIVDYQAAPVRIVRMPVENSAGGYVPITSICRVGSDIMIGTAGYWDSVSDIVNAKVYRFDGSTLTEEDSLAPGANNRYLATFLAPYGEGMVAYYTSISSAVVLQTFRYRDSAGSYSTPANPATAANIPRAISSSVVFKDKLYMAGGNCGDGRSNVDDAQILSFDRTTLVDVRQPTTGATNQSYVAGMISTSTYLYYVWADTLNSSGTGNVYLGRFDGSTWTDNYVTITTGKMPLGMVHNNGKFYVWTKNTSGNTVQIWAASESDPTTWAQVLPATTAVSLTFAGPTNHGGIGHGWVVAV